MLKRRQLVRQEEKRRQGYANMLQAQVGLSMLAWRARHLADLRPQHSTIYLSCCDVGNDKTKSKIFQGYSMWQSCTLVYCPMHG